MTTGASFKRGTSKQNYSTPDDFMEVVRRRFGTPVVDLAADETNRKAVFWIDEEKDSLSVDWHKLGGLLWLNPPFNNISPWAKKCAEASRLGAEILFLVPASVGSNWFRDYVCNRSHVLFLNGRLCFDGIDPYPKDCMLCHYNSKRGVGFSVWTWKNKED